MKNKIFANKEFTIEHANMIAKALESALSEKRNADVKITVYKKDTPTDQSTSVLK